MEAVVLAGGLGTRLRAVVADVPKPMAPIEGRPFLEWLLEYWISQGIRRFVISVGYLAERITSHFGRRWGGAEIAYAAEPAPLGTGGGLLMALGQAQSRDVLLLNGDTFFAVVLSELAEAHRAKAADWTLALFRSTDVQRYLGVGLDAGGALSSLVPTNSGGELLVNGGVYLIRRSSLKQLPWKAGDRFSLESDLLPHGLKAGWRLFGREFSRPFVDIGVPEDYRRAGAVLGACRDASQPPAGQFQHSLKPS